MVMDNQNDSFRNKVVNEVDFPQAVLPTLCNPSCHEGWSRELANDLLASVRAFRGVVARGVAQSKGHVIISVPPIQTFEASAYANRWDYLTLNWTYIAFSQWVCYIVTLCIQYYVYTIKRYCSSTDNQYISNLALVKVKMRCFLECAIPAHSTVSKYLCKSCFTLYVVWRLEKELAGAE